MFKVDGKNMLTKLVDFHLDRKYYERNEKESLTIKKGLIFPIELSANHPKKHKAMHTNLLALFFGNTSVAFAPVENIVNIPTNLLNTLPWKNTSNHDSCWRSDGLSFIDRYYFAMCKEVAPELAPIKVDTKMSFGWLSFKMLDVKVHFNYKPEGYWVNIKKIEYR